MFSQSNIFHIRTSCIYFLAVIGVSQQWRINDAIYSSRTSEIELPTFHLSFIMMNYVSVPRNPPPFDLCRLDLVALITAISLDIPTPQFQVAVQSMCRHVRFSDSQVIVAT